MDIGIAPGVGAGNNSGTGLDRFMNSAEGFAQRDRTDIPPGMEQIGRGIVVHECQSHAPVIGAACIVSAMQPEVIVSITAGNDPAGPFDVGHLFECIKRASGLKSGLVVPKAGLI